MDRRAFFSTTTTIFGSAAIMGALSNCTGLKTKVHEQLNTREKQQAWLESLSQRPYVQKHVESVAQRNNIDVKNYLIHPEWGVVVSEENKYLAGAHSHLYLFSEHAFASNYLKSDGGVDVLKNFVEHNLLYTADCLHFGILGADKGLFERDNIFDSALFHNTVLMHSIVNEYTFIATSLPSTYAAQQRAVRLSSMLEFCYPTLLRSAQGTELFHYLKEKRTPKEPSLFPQEERTYIGLSTGQPRPESLNRPVYWG